MLISGPSGADEVGAGGDIDLRSRVAILPMVVNSTGESAYLRSGLSDMLASRLGRNPRVAVVRIEAKDQATTDAARAAALGAQMGADYVVFGSFTQFGQGASLDLQCIEVAAFDEEAAPQARRVFIQSGTVGEIIPKLDATAQKIGLFVAGPMPAPAPAPAPAVATAPPEAAAPAPAAGPSPEVADLRKRLEAIEDYLFGGASDGVSGADLPENASDFGLR
jgi:TolB-like protein